MKSILSLSIDECEKIVADWEVPKFASLCFFRLNSIPHLDGILIARTVKLADAVRQAHEFGDLLKSKTLMWRSDGRSEAKEYRQGGMTLPVGRLSTSLETLLAAGRDVIILEPLNRFSHRKAFSAIVTDDGNITVECLGAGFDGSDLQRGFVTPEMILQAASEGGRFRPRDFRSSAIDRVSIKERIQQRLLNLGQNIIPNYIFDRLPGESHSEYAKRFLHENHYEALFQERSITVTPSDLRQIAISAEAIFLEFIVKRGWRCLSFNFIQSPERGYVFWDVFEARQKYKM